MYEYFIWNVQIENILFVGLELCPRMPRASWTHINKLRFESWSQKMQVSKYSGKSNKIFKIS